MILSEVGDDVINICFTPAKYSTPGTIGLKFNIILI